MGNCLLYMSQGVVTTPVRQPPTSRKHEARGLHGTNFINSGNYRRGDIVTAISVPGIHCRFIRWQANSQATRPSRTRRSSSCWHPHYPSTLDAHDQLRHTLARRGDGEIGFGSSSIDLVGTNLWSRALTWRRRTDDASLRGAGEIGSLRMKLVPASRALSTRMCPCDRPQWLSPGQAKTLSLLLTVWMKVRRNFSNNRGISSSGINDPSLWTPTSARLPRVWSDTVMGVCFAPYFTALSMRFSTARLNDSRPHRPSTAVGLSNVNREPCTTVISSTTPRRTVSKSHC